MCFAPQRRAIFHLSSGQLRTRRFSEPTFRPSGASNHWKNEPTFRPSGASNHWKNTVFRGFPTFSRICIFFLLTLSLLLFSLLFFSLLSASALLCFSSVHIVGSLTSKLLSTNHSLLTRGYINYAMTCCTCHQATSTSVEPQSQVGGMADANVERKSPIEIEVFPNGDCNIFQFFSNSFILLVLGYRLRLLRSSRTLMQVLDHCLSAWLARKSFMLYHAHEMNHEQRFVETNTLYNRYINMYIYISYMSRRGMHSTYPLDSKAPRFWAG